MSRFKSKKKNKGVVKNRQNYTKRRLIYSGLKGGGTNKNSKLDFTLPINCNNLTTLVRKYSANGNIQWNELSSEYLSKRARQKQVYIIKNFWFKCKRDQTEIVSINKNTKDLNTTSYKAKEETTETQSKDEVDNSENGADSIKSVQEDIPLKDETCHEEFPVDNEMDRNAANDQLSDSTEDEETQRKDYYCLSKETLNIATKSNLADKCVFTSDLTSRNGTFLLRKGWRKQITGDTNRRFNSDLLDFICDKLNELNDCCCFKWRTNRINKVGGRKKSASFWVGSVICTFSACKCTVDMDLPSENSDVVNVSHNGTIRHNANEMKRRKLCGAKRLLVSEELKSTAPSQKYRADISNLSSNAFTSGKRGPTAQVYRNVKHQALVNEAHSLFTNILDLRKIYSKEDKLLSEKRKEKRSFFGCLHFMNVCDEIQVGLFTEGSIRWYHDTVKRDFLFLDATGSLFKNIPGYNKLLYYALVARHPYKNYPPVPIGEFISSLHTKESIALFLSQIQQYEKKIYSVTSVTSPKIIVVDFSLAIIGAILLQYNRLTLMEYLNYCYDVVLNKIHYNPNICAPYVCASHVLKRFKVFLQKKSKLSDEEKPFLLRIMGCLIVSESFQRLEYLMKHLYHILFTPYITDDVLKCLNKLEAIINKNHPAIYDCDDSSTKNDGEEACQIEDSLEEEFDLKTNDEEENLMKKSKLYNHWRQFFNNIEIKESNSVTKNKYYSPEIIHQLQNWYLPMCLLWTKVMVKHTQDNFDISPFHGLDMRSLSDEVNTNVYAEQYFRIKKVTSFKNERRTQSMHEFIIKNKVDNDGMFRQAADGIIVEVEKRKKGKRRKILDTIRVSQQVIGRYESDDEHSADTEDENQAIIPSQESWTDRKDIRKKTKNTFTYLKAPKTPIELAATTPSKQNNKKKIDYADEVEETEIDVYECFNCTMSTSERNNMVRCSRCTKWYHTSCFTLQEFSYPISLFNSNLYCVYCLVDLYREFSLYAFSQKDENIELCCISWNNKSSKEISINPNLIEKNDIRFQFNQVRSVSKRGFENKKSNCWASASVQLLFATPLRELLNNATTPLAKSLSSLFKNMSNDVKTCMSIQELGQITGCCGIKMDTRQHQDVNDFLNSLFEKLVEDPLLSDIIKKLGEMQILNINRCLECGEIQGQYSSVFTLPVPVESRYGKHVINLFSVIYAHFTTEITQGSMICKNCNDKPVHHAIKVVRSFPEVLLVVLERNEREFKAKKSTLVTSKIQINETIDMSFCSMADMKGIDQLYDLQGFCCRTGEGSVNKGHFISFVLDESKSTFTKFDDKKIYILEKEEVLSSDSVQSTLYCAVYRKREVVTLQDSSTITDWVTSDKDKIMLEKLYLEKVDRDLGMVRLESLKTLRGNTWLNSEILDGAFKLLEYKSFQTRAFNHTILKKNQNDLSAYLQVLNKLSQDTNLLILPIHVSNHWLSGCVFLQEKTIIVFDSAYKIKRCNIFQKLLSFAAAICMYRKIKFVKDDWLLLQPEDILHQKDGNNCGVFAFLNVHRMIFEEQSKYSITEEYIKNVRQWLACQLVKKKHKRTQNSLKSCMAEVPNITLVKEVDIIVRTGNKRMRFNDIRQLLQQREEVHNRLNIEKKKVSFVDKRTNLPKNNKGNVDSETCSNSAESNVDKDFATKQKRSLRLQKKRKSENKKEKDFLEEVIEKECFVEEIKKYKIEKTSEDKNKVLQSDQSSVNKVTATHFENGICKSDSDNSFQSDNDSDSDDNIRYKPREPKNKEFYEFIKTKGEQVRGMVTEAARNEWVVRSERVAAYQLGPKKEFLKAAQEEVAKIDNSMPWLYYDEDMEYLCLCIRTNLLMRDKTKEEMEKIGYGIACKLPISIKFDGCLTFQPDIVSFVILPEILAEYLIYTNGCSYKEANKMMNGNEPGTCHHITYLLQDKHIFYKDEVKTLSGSMVNIQLKFNDISEEVTHAIVNAANSNLLHGSGAAYSISKKAGTNFEIASKKHIKDYGPINVGNVAVLDGFELRSHYVFNAVGPRFGIDKNEESLISQAVERCIEYAEERNCKSISIPFISAGIFSKTKVHSNAAVTTLCKAICSTCSKNNYINLKVIRIVGLDETLMVKCRREIKKSIRM